VKLCLWHSVGIFDLSQSDTFPFSAGENFTAQQLHYAAFPERESGIGKEFLCSN